MGWRFSEFDEDFVKIYKVKSKEGHFFEIDIHNLKSLHKFQNNLSFLPERMKIGKVEKLVAILHNKNEHFIHVINLKANSKLWVSIEKGA